MVGLELLAIGLVMIAVGGGAGYFLATFNDGDKAAAESLGQDQHRQSRTGEQ